MGKERFLPRYEMWGPEGPRFGQLPCPPDPSWPPMPGYEHCFRRGRRPRPAPCPPIICRPVPKGLSHCIGQPGISVVDCGPAATADSAARGPVNPSDFLPFDGERVFPDGSPLAGDSRVLDDGRNTKPPAKSASVVVEVPLIGSAWMYAWLNGDMLVLAWMPQFGLVPGVALAPESTTGLTSAANVTVKVEGAKSYVAELKYLDASGVWNSGPNGVMSEDGEMVYWTERLVSTLIELPIAMMVSFQPQWLAIVAAGVSAAGDEFEILPAGNGSGAPWPVKKIYAKEFNLALAGTRHDGIGLTSCLPCEDGQIGPTWPTTQATFFVGIEVYDAPLAG